MKFTLITGLVALAAGVEKHHHHHHRGEGEGEMIPDTFGDKNKDTKEATWAEYKANKPHETDCRLNESKNWYGNSRCRFSWECKGAAMCELHSHGDPGLAGVGWCQGVTACPSVGPLDSTSGPEGSVKLNPGSKPNIDVLHQSGLAQKKHHKKHHYGHH